MADDGIGIEAGKQKEVFELFAQAGHVAGRMKDGLGIGLTMVRMLVEMHGGQVHVSSEGPGAGSVFTIVLPRPTRADERRNDKDMLLVALTGWAQEEDRRASAKAGLDAHLTKPIDPEQLSAELHAIERARRGGD